jgi:hypothetical protein
MTTADFLFHLRNLAVNVLIRTDKHKSVSCVFAESVSECVEIDEIIARRLGHPALPLSWT